MNKYDEIRTLLYDVERTKDVAEAYKLIIQFAESKVSFAPEGVAGSHLPDLVEQAKEIAKKEGHIKVFYANHHLFVTSEFSDTDKVYEKYRK